MAVKNIHKDIRNLKSSLPHSDVFSSMYNDRITFFLASFHSVLFFFMCNEISPFLKSHLFSLRTQKNSRKYSASLNGGFSLILKVMQILTLCLGAKGGKLAIMSVKCASFKSLRQPVYAILLFQVFLQSVSCQTEIIDYTK